MTGRALLTLVDREWMTSWRGGGGYFQPSAYAGVLLALGALFAVGLAIMEEYTFPSDFAEFAREFFSAFCILQFFVLTLLSTGLVIYFIGAHGALRPLRDDITYFHMSIALTSIPFFLFRIFWRISNGMPQTHDLHGVMKFTVDWVWRFEDLG